MEFISIISMIALNLINIYRFWKHEMLDQNKHGINVQN